MTPKRSIVRIQLDRAAKERLEQLCKHRGMTQIAVMSRLVEWFVEQHEVIQLSALGLIPRELAAPAATMLLEQMRGSANTKN